MGIFSGPRTPFFGPQGTWPGPAPGVFLCLKLSAEGQCAPILGVGSFCPRPRKLHPALLLNAVGLVSGPWLPAPPGTQPPQDSGCPRACLHSGHGLTAPSPRGVATSPQGSLSNRWEKVGCSEPGSGMGRPSTRSRPRSLVWTRLAGLVQADRQRPREAAPSHLAQNGYLASV